jgi:hypothetical protein
MSRLRDRRPIRIYTIAEHFKNDDPVTVYRRFGDRGRLAPDGLIYQFIETTDRELIDRLVNISIEKEPIYGEEFRIMAEYKAPIVQRLGIFKRSS